jgi:hypothetical protein
MADCTYRFFPLRLIFTMLDFRQQPGPGQHSGKEIGSAHVRTCVELIMMAPCPHSNSLCLLSNKELRERHRGNLRSLILPYLLHRQDFRESGREHPQMLPEKHSIVA